ncbi:ABC transporter ATP-binding protein, partial [Actinomadura adrarensis]
VLRKGRVVADLPTRELLAGFRERDRYEIRVEGEAPALPPGFDAEVRDGIAVITGRVTEPHEIYDFVDRLRAHGAVLQSLTQVQPDLEDVFLALVKEPVDV